MPIHSQKADCFTFPNDELRAFLSECVIIYSLAVTGCQLINIKTLSRKYLNPFSCSPSLSTRCLIELCLFTVRKLIVSRFLFPFRINQHPCDPFLPCLQNNYRRLDHYSFSKQLWVSSMQVVSPYHIMHSIEHFKGLSTPFCTWWQLQQLAGIPVDWHRSGTTLPRWDRASSRRHRRPIWRGTTTCWRQQYPPKWSGRWPGRFYPTNACSIDPNPWQDPPWPFRSWKWWRYIMMKQNNEKPPQDLHETKKPIMMNTTFIYFGTYAAALKGMYPATG